MTTKRRKPKRIVVQPDVQVVRAKRTLWSLQRIGAEATAVTAVGAMLFGLANYVIPYFVRQYSSDDAPLEGREQHAADIKAAEKKIAEEATAHQANDQRITQQLEQLDVRQQQSIQRGAALNKSVISARIIALRSEIESLKDKFDDPSRILRAKDQTELEELIQAATAMP